MADRDTKSPQQAPETEVAAELVRLIAAGEREAEARLFERYHRGLLFFLRRRVRDEALAEDLAQDAFRVVLERLRDRGLGEPAKLAGFLRSTARNLAIGEFRRRGRRKTDADSEGLERTAADAESPLGETLRKRQAEAVRELLGELGTERDRQILLRFYIGEDDKETICAELGLTSLHFNRVLYRARRRFKEILERHRERWDGALARLLALMAGTA